MRPWCDFPAMNDFLNILKKPSLLVAFFQRIKYYSIDRWGTWEGPLLGSLQLSSSSILNSLGMWMNHSSMVSGVGIQAEEATREVAGISLNRKSNPFYFPSAPGDRQADVPMQKEGDWFKMPGTISCYCRGVPTYIGFLSIYLSHRCRYRWYKVP